MLMVVAVVVVVAMIVIVTVVVVVVAMTVAMTVMPLHVDGAITDWIGDASEVLQSRLGVQFTQQVIGTGVRKGLRDPTGGIVQITKRDRTGGTCFLARTLDRPIGNRPVLSGGCPAGTSPFILVLDLRRRDVLSTEGTLLHDTTAAHRDLGIELHPSPFVGPLTRVVLGLDGE